MNEWNDICAMLAKYNGIEESFPKQKFTSRRNRKKPSNTKKHYQTTITVTETTKITQ